MSLFLLLVACGGQPSSRPPSTGHAAPTIESPPPAIGQLSLKASPPAKRHEAIKDQHVSWQGLTMDVPPDHVWHAGPYGEGHSYSAPIIAQARMNYDVAAAPAVPEVPDGIGFTIVHFAGTPEQWVAAEQHTRTGPQAIDPQTIRPVTIAGQRTTAYSYVVTGVARSETYPLKITPDHLLLIESSNADNPAYQAVVNSVSIEK